MIELEVMAAPARTREAPDNDLGTALSWRTWPEGLEEAREHRKPVLCVAEDPWCNAAQRLALFLERDPELAPLIEGSYVPVLVDPREHPDLIDRILKVAMQVEPTVSPPLIAVCTEEGLPLVTSCDITFEGTDERPTLLALLRTTHEHYDGARKDCLVEARGLQQTDPRSAQGVNHFLPVWELLRQPDRELLDTMLGSGIHDQLAGGFHRATRQPGYGVPHFEKLGAHNAGMAALLLRTGRPELREHASACADFAMRSLRTGSAGLASDTAYYTWASDEILSSLPAGELQMVGLHFRISASSSRHVLNQVRSVEQSIELASGQTDEEARALLEAGKQRLLAVRNSRQHPAQLAGAALNEELTTVRWLIEAARYDPELVNPELPLTRLGEVLQGTDAGNGPARPDGSRWLHDQVSAAHAAHAAARLEGSGWEQAARDMAAVLDADYRDGDSWKVHPEGQILTAGWFDADLPAVRRELQELGQ